jgi:hypothetical protein
MSIPEEVRRTVAAKLVQEASLLDEYADEHILDAARAAVFAFSADARRLAARALTGELEAGVMRDIAVRIRNRRAFDGPGADAYDAADWVDEWADELEASMKGGNDVQR